MPNIRNFLPPSPWKRPPVLKELTSHPAPEPIFFSHVADKKGHRSIKESGRILPMEGPVPVSLDGGIVPWPGGYKFLFPILELTGKIVEPVFYLGTGDSINTEAGANFLVMDMTCIFATEVRIHGELDISRGKALPRYTPIPPTGLIAFLSLIWPELQAHGRGLITGSYTPTLLAIVDAYNRMVSNLFGIDYNEVKRVASTSDIWEIKWWETF